MKGTQFNNEKIYFTERIAFRKKYCLSGNLKLIKLYYTGCSRKI